MNYKRSEIGAGIFLFVSFAVLAVLVFAVSDIQSLFKKKKEVKVLFLYSDGIEQNAQVRFSGIKIGKVAGIRVAPEQGDKIELTLSVFSDAVIKKDTRAAVKTLGLVGGKYVELTGGNPQSPPLEPGGILVGEESFKLEDLTKAGLEVVGKLKNIANNLDRIIGDPAMARSIKATVQNVHDMTSSIKSMTSGTVQTIVQNVQETTENVKTMTSSKEALAQGLKNLPEILKKVEEATANLKAITEKSDKLVGENRKNIDETLENIRQMTQNLKELTEDVKKSPWKLIRKP